MCSMHGIQFQINRIMCFITFRHSTRRQKPTQNGIKEMELTFTWFHGIGYVDKYIVTAV